MAPEAMNNEQHREVQQIAELETRRYFDHYLSNVWPEQQQALKDYCDGSVQAHDQSPDAHGGTERKMNRFVWILIGASAASGAGGAGALRVLMSLGG